MSEHEWVGVVACIALIISMLGLVIWSSKVVQHYEFEDHPIFYGELPIRGFTMDGEISGVVFLATGGFSGYISGSTTHYVMVMYQVGDNSTWRGVQQVVKTYEAKLSEATIVNEEGVSPYIRLERWYITRPRDPFQSKKQATTRSLTSIHMDLDKLLREANVTGGIEWQKQP